MTSITKQVWEILDNEQFKLAKAVAQYQGRSVRAHAKVVLLQDLKSHVLNSATRVAENSDSKVVK